MATDGLPEASNTQPGSGAYPPLQLEQPDDLSSLWHISPKSNDFHLLVPSELQTDMGDALITKFEEPRNDVDFPKDESYDSSVDVKFPVSQVSIWQDSEELINLVLGDDRSLSESGIRLDDNVYALANLESRHTLFPVLLYCLLSGY